MRQTNGPIRLEYRQSADCDGALRLTLLDEVDIAVAADLEHLLEQLEHARTRTRLDLSELRFIDLGGLDTILVALAQARRTGWELEVAPSVSPIVARVIGLAGVGAILWPPQRPLGDQTPARSERAAANCSASSPGSHP
jgi:anti-anti-sigma factor